MTDDDKLPPLKPKSENKPQDRSSINTTDDLKKKILLLYPQVQKVEKELISFKQQIPPNLNKTLLQLRQDLQRLNEADQPPLDEVEEETLRNALHSLEERIKERVEESLKNLSDNVEKQIENTMKNGDILENDIELNRHYDSKFLSLEKLMNQQQRNIQKRISQLEQGISKMSVMNPPFSKGDNDIRKIKLAVEKSTDDMDILRLRIEELQRLADIQKSFQYKKEEEIKQRLYELTQNSNNTTQLINEMIKRIPDYTGPLQNLQQELAEFQNEFESKITFIDLKASACEQLTEELELMAMELKESTDELESHATEAEGLCRDLTETVDNLNRQMSDDSNFRTMQSMAVQIRTVHDTLRMEIENMKERLKLLEFSFPFSNIRTKNSNS